MMDDQSTEDDSSRSNTPTNTKGGTTLHRVNTIPIIGDGDDKPQVLMEGYH